jgi:hypothetical protein
MKKQKVIKELRYLGAMFDNIIEPKETNKQEKKNDKSKIKNKSKG